VAYKNPYDLRLAVKHLGFDVEYNHPEGQRLDLGKEELARYIADRAWARVFVAADGRALSASDLFADALKFNRQCTRDSIMQDTEQRARMTGAAGQYHSIPITCPPKSLFAETTQGRVEIKSLMLKMQITATKRQANDRKYETTDKPFVIFSSEADADYLLARMLNFAGAAFHGRAGYSAHQACEKYLKAFSVFGLGEFAYSHRLLDLAKHCAELNPYFENPDLISKLKIFDEFAEVGRYGAAARFDPHARKESSVTTAGVYTWSEAYLGVLDAIVFDVRGLLNFESYPSMDMLRAILNRDKRNLFVHSWALNMPLRVVLTRKNAVFK
jgi:HEPN domain-containing protein